MAVYTIEAQEWVKIEKAGFKVPPGPISDFFYEGRQYVGLSEEQVLYLERLVPPDKIKTLQVLFKIGKGDDKD